MESKDVPPSVEEWGRRAKREILSKEEALKIAQENNIFLEGIMGSHAGVIGALAAVGLRKTGNDGRFIWLPGKQFRDLRGPLKVGEIKKGTQLDDVMTKDGRVLEDDVMIDLTDWVRAVLINSKSYIIVERNLKRSGSDWIVADKDYIRKMGS